MPNQTIYMTKQDEQFLKDHPSVSKAEALRTGITLMRDEHFDLKQDGDEMISTCKCIQQEMEKQK